MLIYSIKHIYMLIKHADLQLSTQRYNNYTRIFPTNSENIHKTLAKTHTV